MGKFRISFLLIMLLMLSVNLFAQVEIRVNCGGESYNDRSGNKWERDQEYRPGSWGYDYGGYAITYSTSIRGTNDDPLYQAERNALENYRFDVPDGKYVVTLKFAELYYRHEGERIFHVAIEGKRVLSDFDMVATAGFATAIDYTFEVEVTDGRLDIKFITIYTAPGVSIAHANIKAIAVVEQGSHEPKLWVNEDLLNFREKLSRKSFEITNGGSLPLEWSLFENPEKSWITSVTPTSGSLLQGEVQRVEVFVSRIGLDDGGYNGDIAITSNGGDDNVAVEMEVSSRTPIMEVKPVALGFGSLLTKRTFTIRNGGLAELNWSARNRLERPWISEILPERGAIASGDSQIVTVTIDRGTFSDSTYNAVIALNSNGGNENILVSMEVGNDPVRINCGGPHYLDESKQIWFGDFGFDGGEIVNREIEIANSEIDPIYQRSRAGVNRYHFPVQNNGLYEFTLHFADLESAIVGERIFDLTIEDSLVLEDFDIYANAGLDSAWIKSVKIPVNDNQVDLVFNAKTGSPIISGLEMFQIPTDPYLSVQPEMLDFGEELDSLAFYVENLGVEQLSWHAAISQAAANFVTLSSDSGTLGHSQVDTVWVTLDRTGLPDGLYNASIVVGSNGGMATIVAMARVGAAEPYLQRVNTGGDVYTDAKGNVWAKDQKYQDGSWGYVGGEVYEKHYRIENTEDDQLYQTERWGLKQYAFDVPRGAYVVTLHLAEIYHRKVGRRIMDVEIEGEKVLENFDIIAQAGRKTALVKTFNTLVKDGILEIDFSATVDEPKISAIEVQSSFGRPDLKKEIVDAPVQFERAPHSMRLNQNYPNPFNMETIISYEIPTEAKVTLEIFNLLGQKELTLVNDVVNAGFHSVKWNGLDHRRLPVASGIYIYRIHISPKDKNVKAYSTIRKMLLVK